MRNSVQFYRALQEFKEDDLTEISRLLAQRAGTLDRTDGRGVVIDLCSGTGRTVGLYDADKWDVVCVDHDAEALEILRRRFPYVTTVEGSIGESLDLPVADVIICAHNSANEIPSLEDLFGVVNRQLADDGTFFLELLIDDGPYPREFNREFVRVVAFGDQMWALETVVVTHADRRFHDLVLLGTRISDSISEQINQVCHRVQRRVYSLDEIDRYVNDVGLKREPVISSRSRFILKRERR